MNGLNTKSWYTGDWKQINNLQAPYNGLKISATANYGPGASLPTDRKPVSVLIEVVDYTYDQNGISSELILTKGSWNYIPIPQDTSLLPPESNSKFTVSGIGNSALGKIQLVTYYNGIFLQVEFCYGPTNGKREELGFIMNFSDNYPEGIDQ